METDTEIIGITTCGTYPSWVDHTVSSIYNHVDKIIVVNSGYNIKNIEYGPYYRLEREHKLLQKIDIHNKILEYTPHFLDHNKASEDLLLSKPSRHSFKQLFKEGKDELGRTSNITLSTILANESFTTSKPHWILKLDSDQIFYQFKRQELESLLTTYPDKTGFRFAQYADYFHDFYHISNGLPDNFTNDGAIFYKSLPNQRYGGQGSPDINTDQYEITTIKTSHMRRISPSNIEEYEYLFNRYWYHTFGPNSIMEHDYNRKTGQKLTNEDIIKIAHKEAISSIKENGVLINSIPKDERIPYEPPLVCQLTPLEYIKKGY